MRIQHNIMAMNAYRNYNTNTSALSKNLEKLSSGYKINRAGDDAAGLAISEKMRAQITGLNAAQKNVKDGISLVKTAEGAMQEVQDMLNRMDYLATQSANGTYDNEVDRNNLQKEVDALKTEINRIADSANFNGIKLLDGSQAGTTARSAYTETLTPKDIKGVDRILSADIGANEQPWQVNNEKNVYDKFSNPATKASFSISFDKLEGSFKPAAGSISAGTIAAASLGGSFKVTINGGNAITISASALGSAIKVTVATNGAVTASVNAAKIASAVVTAIKGTKANATMEINGVTWKASADASGKVTFTQVANPTKQEECRANFTVKIEYGDAKGEVTASKGTFTLKGSMLDGTQVEKVGAIDGGTYGAETVFRMEKSDIVDGAVLKLGNETYTLAVGAGSKYANLTSNKIDLTMMDANNIDLHEALTRISEEVGSVAFKSTNAQGGEVNATFKIGVADGKDHIGIAIMRTDDIDDLDDVAFTNKAKLAEFFGIKHEGGTLDHEAVEASGGLMLQIGDTSDNFNQMRVIIGDMHTKGMGIEDVNISNQQSAQAAVSTIRDAINYVSGIRGDLGAIQNRLEHTGNNLSVMAENIQDAESTIRDTDVAEEMMSYVKNNILVQSAQAMLAQANQVPQGVLQLLG